MKKNDRIYNNYLQILREELVPAMGCTEPIALAYASAKARDVLGVIPQEILIEASGNIVKNVKSVVVPNTGGMKGMEAAVAAGIIAGDHEAVLEVISLVSPQQKERIKEYLQEATFKVALLESSIPLDMKITLIGDGHRVTIRISDYHTNIVYLEKDGEILFDVGVVESKEEKVTDKSLLTVEGICDFAEKVDLIEIQDVLERQIQYNMAISLEGLKNSYGANIGKVLRNNFGEDIKNLARAFAAAGSDARMSGCELPVVIVSGSGNQGITASVPVVLYGEHLQVPQEKILRALIISNLCTIHQKTSIGRLSAFCGAVSAGAGAGAGIAYLNGGGYIEIAHTIVNALGIVSGMICDGAKPSCAAKIASSVDAGILGYLMYQEGQQFLSGEGLIIKGVENTIRNIGRLGKYGMKETDKEIIRMMVGD